MITQDEIIEIARSLGICELTSKPKQSIHYSLTIHEMETFSKLVADVATAKERSEMRKGYAGVTLWVGDACVTQIVSEASIENEINSGMALEYAANKCLALYREARGEA